MVRWSIRKARDRYRRVTDRSNEKVEGIALVVCREIDVIDEVEVSK